MSGPVNNNRNVDPSYYLNDPSYYVSQNDSNDPLDPNSAAYVNPDDDDSSGDQSVPQENDAQRALRRLRNHGKVDGS